MSTDSCELGGVMVNIVLGGYRVDRIIWIKISNVRGDPIYANILQDIIVFWDWS